MELEKVLHMKGGIGETSYSQTAYIARRVISMTKPIREEAMAQLFSQDDDNECPIKNSTLCIADLGCASGPNTFTVVSELIIASENISRKMNRPELEYQIYLNDLPGNDFNSVFKSLRKFHEELGRQIQCFVMGVPGSFYGRLFPRQSLHFAHSSYSLYWLSQVPKGVEGNKRNIYVSSTSPANVVKAYKDQFQKDTASFLKSRSEELVKSGRMVLTYWGRSTEDPTTKESCFLWDFLATALNELVSEGVIEEEKVEEFNIPIYHASSTEVVEEVKKEGSFNINTVDVSEVNLNDRENEGDKKGDPSKLLRSIVESLLSTHFGGAVVDEVFRRVNGIIEAAMTKHSVFLTNVTISLIKK